MRSRRKVVSSLLLWIDRHTADTGGRIWRRMRAPLLFFVELLALALLVLAAADPLWRRAGRIPAIIQFPMINGGLVILATALSALLYHERITRRTVVGLVIGLVALILLS